MPQVFNLGDPSTFILFTVVMFVIVLGRYFLIAGIFHAIFYVWFPQRWQQRRLAKVERKKKQFYSELKWSILTTLIFSVAGAFTILLWQKGFTRVYNDLYAYGLWYLPVSLGVYMFIHETYYYWLHRWMHKPAVFKLVHKVHHDSKTTSAWTAFSFHPLEGMLQSIILPLTILFIPIHLYVLIVLLTIMTMSSVVNHLEVELYPANFHKHSLGKWLIGATHHSLHHKQFKYNFGLYFTFWDKLKKTESPIFKSLYKEKTGKKA